MKARHKDCVMEVSSHALALGRVDDIQFNTLYLQTYSDHLDFHKTWKIIIRRSFVRESTCIINWDDPYGERLYELKVDNKEVLAYSLLQKTQIICRNSDYNEKSTTIEVYNNNRAQG